MNEFGLSEKTMSTIHSIYAQFPAIERVLVYGSRAKGCYREGSDIDMAIIATPPLQLSDLAKISGLFYNSSIPYLVDISDFSKLTNQALIEHIKRVGKIIYQK